MDGSPLRHNLRASLECANLDAGVGRFGDDR